VLPEPRWRPLFTDGDGLQAKAERWSLLLQNSRDCRTGLCGRELSLGRKFRIWNMGECRRCAQASRSALGRRIFRRGDRCTVPKTRECQAFSLRAEMGPERPHWLAGAPGFEPGNGGIKISLIIQLFQGAFGKKSQKCPLAISIAWQSFPNEEVALTGRISREKPKATGLRGCRLRRAQTSDKCC
jgi:hypothetical protein